MSLQNLKLILQKQVNDTGAITITEATLTDANLVPSPNFDTTIQKYLKLTGTLSVAVTGNIPAPTGKQLTVAGTASFLGVSTISVQIVFTLEINNTINILVIATLPVSWKFSDSFPMLSGFPFAELSITQPYYLLTTAAQTNYTWNGQQLSLAQGLNFVSFLGMGGSFSIIGDMISSLAPNDTVMLTGTIDTSDTADILFLMPGLSLTGIINHPISATTSFELSLPQVLLTSLPDENGYLAYWLIFSSTLSVQGKPFSTFQAAILKNSPNLSLSMLSTTNPITPAEIMGLIAGVDYTMSIPPVLESIFESVGLVELYATINVKTMDIMMLGGGIGTTSPWTMGQFQIENMVLNCQVFHPFKTEQSVLFNFRATASIFPDIFKGEFVFEIGYDLTSKEMVIAANFMGKVSLNDLVAGLSDNTIIIPKNIADIEFEDFGMTFIENGGKYDYTLHGNAEGTFNITLLDSQIVSTFEVRIDSSTKTYVLVGGLTIGNSFFEATASLSGGKQVLSGSWNALNEDYLNINDILSAFNLPNVEIPTDLDLGLKSASLAYDFTDNMLVIGATSINFGEAVFAAFKDSTTQKWEFYFDLNVGKTINLSNLPLVNKVLPTDATLSLGLRLLYGSAANLNIDAINQLLPEGVPKISNPGQDTNEKGIHFIADIKLGGQGITLPLSTKPADGSSTTAINATTASNPAPVQDDITWLKIGKSFGPVIFNRIGLTYKDSLLSVYPDAALSTGGLTLTLNGLSVSSPITTFKPTFNLKGLGIDFKNGPLEIGASFLRRALMINNELVKDSNGGQVYEYDGMAIIKTEELSISALGSYCYIDDHSSLFIYAYLNQALGGPGFFFVEGLAAAFGYNRSLIMPNIDQVSTFPLVRQVMEGDDPAATTTDHAQLLTQQLDAISKYIPPAAGEMFFAIGVKFNSFKLIDSFVLLAVQFGNHVEIDVLGQSNIIVPSEVPPGISPLAEIKIQLMAKFLPEEGFLAVRAQLTTDSYILSKDCHLSGGAAFYSWFKGDHEGDFVVTMGGYHPAFNVPAHYPQVPRLALNWQVSSELSIKGDMYFALCAHAFMAGGHLEALYTDGPLQAWFKAGADFLIMWQPYHYDARMYLDIGASYTYHFFGTHHITVDVGADVHIWGPEFAGQATIHIWIVNVSVSFGPQGSASPAPIGWEEFKSKCIPASEKIISTAITQGQHNENENRIPIVNPKELRIAISSVVPVTGFRSENKELDTVMSKEEPTFFNSFGIAPMAISGINSSNQTITISKQKEDESGDWEPCELDNFLFTSVSKKVPSAIWGKTFTPDLNSTEKTIEVVTGLNITTQEPKELPVGGNDFKSLDDLLDFRNPLECSDTIPELVFNEEHNKENLQIFRNTNLSFDALCNDMEFDEISVLT